MFLRENVSIWNLPRPEGSIVGRPSWLRLPHPLPPALECQRQPGQGQEELKSEAREAAQAPPQPAGVPARGGQNRGSFALTLACA